VSAEVPRDWYDGFFEREYLDEFAPRLESERTSREVDFVVEKLELEPGARVLDVGCGHGRHTIELARRGFRVTGVDLSARSLDLAREAARQAGVDADFVQLDARDLAYDGAFDAAVNLFTAVLGYFEDERDDRRLLERVARALRPGGRFLVDTINVLGLAGGFRETNWEQLESGTVFLERRAFDAVRGRTSAVWTFLHADGRRNEVSHSLRVYSPPELIGMLRGAGLDVVGAWGGWDGAELSLGSWRLILRGDRPS
jgi:2-polyprenyl-3-methyl-5-hydroxy-6-metoxy-1,4-benzoquinol methylase